MKKIAYSYLWEIQHWSDTPDGIYDGTTYLIASDIDDALSMFKNEKHGHIVKIEQKQQVIYYESI